MIKRSLVLFCALAVWGCSYGQNYLENPEMIIRDPHFAAYQKDRDDLEIKYVRKEITYAQYIEKRQQIDQKYDREVQERTDKIMSPE